MSPLETRLTALRDYAAFDAELSPEFERITLLAQSVSKAPVAFISLLGATKQHLKAQKGTNICETSIEVSFCAYTILSAEPMIVPDASLDPRFSANPLVTQEPHIRMYCGFPLITESGVPIGTLCVVNTVPGTLSLEQITQLKELAFLTIDLFERRKLAVDLREEIRQHDDTMRSISSIMISVGAEGEVRRFNKGAETAFGIDAWKVLGQKLAVCEENYGWPLVSSQLENGVGDGNSLRLPDLSFRTSEGETKFLGLQLHKIWSRGQHRGYLIQGADITEKRAQQRALAKAEADRKRMEGLITTISTEFITSDSREYSKTVNECLRSLCNLMELERAAYYVFTEAAHFRLDDEFIVNGFGVSSAGKPSVKATLFPDAYAKLKQLETVQINVADPDPEHAREKARLTELGLRSSILIPVYTGKNLKGFLSFASVRPIEPPSPEVIGLLRVFASMLSGLHDRIKAEEQYRILSERTVESYRTQLDQVVTNAPIVLFSIKQDGEITLWDGRGLEAIEQHPGQFVGRNIFEVYAGHEAVENSLKRSLNGESFSREIQVKNATFETHFSPAFDEHGAVIGVKGVALDVSDRVKADKTLRVRDQAISAARNGIVICDAGLPGFPIIYANATFQRMTGYSEQEILGQSCRFLQGEDRQQSAIREIRAALIEGAECRVVLRNYRKDGTMFWNELTMYPVRGEEGEITNFVGVQDDITERRAMEAQFSHSQRMESVGQLAAGIAHEINTPMQYIGDNVRFLSRAFQTMWTTQARLLESRLDDPEFTLASLVETARQQDKFGLLQEIPLAVDQTLEGIDRVSKIVQGLKEFSHPGTEEFVEVDIERAIVSTVNVTKNEWKYVAELSTEIQPDLPRVWCLPGEFNQVLLVLIVNAAHAIKDRVEEEKYAIGQISVSARVLDSCLVVRVSDNGGGVPSEIQSKIFEPFYTTKPVGKGTGQGLAISRKIICDLHKGQLTCESVPGEGATFVIKIPVCQESVERLVA